MKKNIFILLFLVTTIICVGQNNINEDKFKSYLIDAIDRNKYDKTLFQCTINIYRQNEDSSILFKRKQFLSKEWKKIIEYYRYTDFVILINESYPNKYIVFNHCYKHEIITNNTDQISEIKEITINEGNEIECLETKRPSCK